VLVVHARTKGKCPWGLIWCLGCLLYGQVLVLEKRDQFYYQRDELNCGWKSLPDWSGSRVRGTEVA
jgi:late competence protein required for DNA uptake (superfamily II DNA/RNA helicase)